MKYDKIIIGAGLYGLYSALFCLRRGESVLVLECDEKPFSRATYINQARVHGGYHYPRSLSTAIKSAGYFERFNREYDFCINKEFEQVYATSEDYSWTDGIQFKKFCDSAGIPCKRVPAEEYFKDGQCSGAFITREYTYDAKILCDYFLAELAKYATSFCVQYSVNIVEINRLQDDYEVVLSDGSSYKTGFLLNATYASTNQLLDKLGYEKFKIKYELCEIILCEVNDKLRDVGITVMDGPFFSIMPFGKTGLHSLTSVTFTPHKTSYDITPKFECQSQSDGLCSQEHLYNCNLCCAKPKSAYQYMSNLAHKYMKECYGFEYKDSLFSMKPILMASEIDDSRPTVVRVYSQSPTFVSVLSGKINTVYDLDEVLTNG